MKALRVRDGQVRLEDVPAPQPTEGEALIRVALAGVCNTDIEIVRGYMGFEGTLGHEFVGVVEACDDASWIGKRVCADINVACGACDLCTTGDPHHCPDRTVLGIVARDGVFAERVTLPTRNLVPVPDSVPDESAVFSEPLAAAFEILEQVDVESSSRVLVLGDGKLGLLCAMALRTTGCDLTLAGRHPAKLALLTGVRTRTELDELGFDVVIEATGSPNGLAEALARVRSRGTVVLKSTYAGQPTVDTNRIVVEEIRIVGSRCGPMHRALEAMASGAVDPRALIHDRLPLEVGALDRARERGTLKVLIEP